MGKYNDVQTEKNKQTKVRPQDEIKLEIEYLLLLLGNFECN